MVLRCNEMLLSKLGGKNGPYSNRIGYAIF
jgi:hypothetical protein